MARVALFKHLAKRVPLEKNNGGEWGEERLEKWTKKGEKRGERGE